MSDGIDPERFEAMATRLDAMREEIWDLEDENEHLRQRVAELERVVDPNPSAKAYSDLSPDEKVFKLRRALFRKALHNGGNAAIGYSDARTVFDYQSSAGHTYNLMEAAGEIEGYNYTTRHDEKKLTVNAERVTDETIVQSVNNELSETPA